MVEVPRYILDASVAAKWHLRDEDHSEKALQLLQDYREDKVDLLAPDHIRYEVASSIRTAVLTKRLTVEKGRASLAEFFSWRIPTVRGDSLIMFAYQQAFKLNCSFYDGLYLALARSTNAPLVYADARLRRNLGNRFPLALWIEDYQPV